MSEAYPPTKHGLHHNEVGGGAQIPITLTDTTPIC